MKTLPNRAWMGPHTPTATLVRDVVRFAALAVAAGVVFAVLLVLAILGLTVVSPPAGASSGAEIRDVASSPPSERPGDQTSGSFLMRVRPGGEYLRSPVLSTDVKISVSGVIARATVSQQFRNDSQDWVEGIYVFPLPENAAVDRLRMQIGDRLVEGQVRERARARAEYEKAREAGNIASLVEQERPNLFTSSVANLGPGQTLTVVIEYQQTLRYEEGGVSLRFPTTVTPRYIPGNPRSEKRGSGWSPDTDQVADASRITPAVLDEGGKPRNPVTLQVELDAGFPVDKVTSPYHTIKVGKRDDGRQVVTLEGAVPADRDFELAWSPLPGSQPRGTLFRETAGGETHLLLTLFPPVGARADEHRMPREVIYVIDTSGSMEGTSIAQARKALLLALGQLAPEDRFNIIQFNSMTQVLFASPRAADLGNLTAARRYVDRLRATGGTEMLPAMHAALDFPAKEGYLRQIVFMTDGAVGNEDALFRLIQDKLGRARLFTVGIGSAPNGHFMTKAAQLGRGTFTYIGDVAEVGEKMAALFAKLEHPVLSDIAVEWPQGVSAEVSPGELPDLYLGEPVVLSARVDGQLAGALVVRGRTSGEAWQTELNLQAAHDGKGMGVIWARRKIEALLDSLHQGAEREKVREEVVAIALKHHLVTRYTSLVSVDMTPARPAGEPFDSQSIPVNLPQGQSHDAIFGSLPKTGTPALLHVAIAIIAAGLAFVVFMIRRLS